jgi:hypothetical protein
LPVHGAEASGTPASTPAAPRPIGDLAGSAFRTPHTASPELPRTPSEKPAGAEAARPNDRLAARAVTRDEAMTPEVGPFS